MVFSECAAQDLGLCVKPVNHSVYCYSEVNADSNPNSSILACFMYDVSTYERKAQAMILHHLLKEQIFNQLRTQE